MTTLLQRGRGGESLADMDIIDMHGHLGRYHFAIPDLTPAALVATMDRIGVRAVLCSHTTCMQGDVRRGNDEVLAACRAHPGRIMGYVALWPTDARQVQAEARRCLDGGFVGVKLHNINGFPYTDSAYEPALALADERRMPVLLHTWGKDEEFDQVRRLAEKFPETSILLAHAGAAKPAEYARAARECHNVYLDTCFSKAPRGLVAQLVEEAGAEKVLWGSDAIFLNMAQQIGKVLGAKISEADKTKLLSRNARRLLERIRPAE